MKQDPLLKGRARQLRRDLTPAEKILWSELRGRRLGGFKFRRQYLAGAYILDFYCPEVGVAVEVDGETHLGREQPDKSREAWLKTQGIEVLRFWNTEVYDDHEAVVEAVWRTCQRRRG